MKRTAYRVAWIILALLLVASAASAGGPEPKIKIATDGAPNLFGSPSWEPWVHNAIYEIRTGGPDSFEDQAVVGPSYFVVSEFGSWLGQYAPPGSPYADERGTRLHWVTRVTAPRGQTINISAGLTFNLEWNPMVEDFLHQPNFDSFPFTVSTYTGRVLGVDYGTDGVKGTGDDLVLTSGIGEVEEIVMVRPGLAYAPDEDNDEPGQASLDAVYAYVEDFGMLHFRACASFAGGKTTCSNLLLNSQAKGRGVTGIAPAPVTD